MRRDRAKLRGGGSKGEEEKQNLANRDLHFQRITRVANDIVKRFEAHQLERQLKEFPHLGAGIPFLVRIEDESDVDFLRSAFEFEVVSQQEDGFVLVAANDLELSRMMATMGRFIDDKRGGGRAAKLYEIVSDLDSSQRFNRIVGEDLQARWHSLSATDKLTVDISVECLGQLPTDPGGEPIRDVGDSDEKYAKKVRDHKRKVERYPSQMHEFYLEWDDKRMARADDLRRLVEGHGGEVLSITDDAGVQLPDSFTLRVILGPEGLKDIVDSYPYLFEVISPDATVPPQETPGEGYQDKLVILPPEASAPTVCVIDSGMQENHRLIRAAIRVVESECFVPGLPATEVADYVSPGGHGTRVAGRILFPEGVSDVGEYQLLARVQNARVLDRENALWQSAPAGHYLKPIVEKYGKKLGTVIFNHSVSSNRASATKHMSHWGALMDLLAHEHEVLFVQASGNAGPTVVTAASKRGAGYPAFLLHPEHRIRNPGQSLHALTVGSVSPGDYDSGGSANVGHVGTPSAFSTCGHGLWNSVKPDVVEVGGDYAIGPQGTLTTPPELCPSMPRSTLYGGPEHDRDVVGTSFAAARVSALAARIGTAIPGAQGQLIRALVVQSAGYPDFVHEWPPDERLRTMGFGIPDWERATENTPYRITLVTEALRQIPAREAHVYQIPIPLDLRRAGLEDEIRITITLAYTAAPRRTRRTHRFYNSVWLDWIASKREEGLEQFLARAIETGTKQRASDLSGFDWHFGERIDRGDLLGLRRQNGSVQKDWTTIPAHDLPSDLCIAVRGHRGWDTNPDSMAKYALVVTVESIGNRLPMYARIQSAVEQVGSRVQERVRINP